MIAEFVNLGADPEFFVHTGKEYFPAVPFVNGTKKHPEKLPPLSFKGKTRSGFYMQKDNILLEGNIPPAYTKEEFIEYIEFLKTYFNTVLLAKKDFHIRCESSARFKPRFLRLPEAQDFGCDPSFNAWTSSLQEVPRLDLVDTRPAGFHIHIGYRNLYPFIFANRLNKGITKAFDVFVVNPARHHHFDEFRSLSYGRFGSYRNTSYGVECRALGGHFLKKEYLGWIWDQTVKAVNFIFTESNLDKMQNYTLRQDTRKFLSEDLYEYLGVSLSDQFIKIKEVEHA